MVGDMRCGAVVGVNSHGPCRGSMAHACREGPCLCAHHYGCRMHASAVNHQVGMHKDPICMLIVAHICSRRVRNQPLCSEGLDSAGRCSTHCSAPMQRMQAST